VAVDENWESEIKGLYSAGEAAGTFGVYRPGGSALNSTQVGSLRAAEHIARKEQRNISSLVYDMPNIRYGASNIKIFGDELRENMSLAADFDRNTVKMQRLFERVSSLAESFFETAVISDESETAELYRLYDTVITQRAVLSAMLLSAREIGSHGSAFVDGMPQSKETSVRNTRTLTKGDVSFLSPVSQMPTPELWFETLLARKQKEMKI
jgi:succinate dehydrogenase/fumarate reductase flavoprotein subunit